MANRQSYPRHRGRSRPANITSEKPPSRRAIALALRVQRLPRVQQAALLDVIDSASKPKPPEPPPPAALDAKRREGIRAKVLKELGHADNPLIFDSSPSLIDVSVFVRHVLAFLSCVTIENDLLSKDAEHGRYLINHWLENALEWAQEFELREAELTQEAEQKGGAK